jgi:recombining binding protein (suppressor of hairless)
MPSGGPVSGEAINIAEAGPSGNHHHTGDTPQTIVAPPRFVPSGPLHTIIIVDLPPINDIVKTLQDGMMSLAAGAAQAARMMAPASAPRSPSTEQGRDGRSEDVHDASTSDHQEAGPSSGPAQPILAEGSQSHSHPTMSGLEDVQGPEHGGPLPGQALPLLFIRGSDGMGYHSGRSIACDHLFHDMTVNAMHGRSPTDGRSPVEGGWLAAAQAAVGADAGLQGWSLRVI